MICAPCKVLIEPMEIAAHKDKDNNLNAIRKWFLIPIRLCCEITYKKKIVYIYIYIYPSSNILGNIPVFMS